MSDARPGTTFKRPVRRASLVAPAAVVLSLLAPLACGDAPSGPVGPVPTAPLTLCAPDWMAYRNEGGEWTRVASGDGGPVTFEATERLVIALASSVEMPNVVPYLVVVGLTAEQARARFGCVAGGAAPPPGRVSAIVRGLASGGWAEVHYGGLPGYSVSGGSDSSYTVWAFDGDNDLVATRWPSALQFYPDHADRAIVRHAQRYAAGSSIVLDFASAEAFPLAQHTLSWTGASAHVQVNFLPAEGGQVLLQSTVTGNAGSQGQRSVPLHSIPAGRLAPGDLHRLMVGEDQRAVELYYHAPRDRTIALGPPVATPTFTMVGTAPHPRVRATVPSQAQYGAEAWLSLQQNPPPGSTDGPWTRITLGVTREHLGGTPRTWTLELPDLSGVPGFLDVFGPRAGAFTWGVDVNSGPAWLMARDARDGLVVRYGSAYGQGTFP